MVNMTQRYVKFLVWQIFYW